MSFDIFNKFNTEKVYLLYIFSFPIYFGINNFISKLIRFLYFGILNSKIHISADICATKGLSSIDFASAQKGFFTFLVLKFLIVFAGTLFYYFKPRSISAVLAQHFVLAFLSIDLLFLIYIGTSFIFPELPNYFFSGTDQLLGHYIFGFPKFLVSLFWSIVLVVIVLGVLNFDIKKLVLLISISALSFLIFSNGLIYFLRYWQSLFFFLHS